MVVTGQIPEKAGNLAALLFEAQNRLQKLCKAPGPQNEQKPTDGKKVTESSSIPWSYPSSANTGSAAVMTTEGLAEPFTG